MSDESKPNPEPASAPESPSARPDVGMVFETLLASGDLAMKGQP